MLIQHPSFLHYSPLLRICESSVASGRSKFRQNLPHQMPARPQSIKERSIPPPWAEAARSPSQYRMTGTIVFNGSVGKSRISGMSGLFWINRFHRCCHHTWNCQPGKNKEQTDRLLDVTDKSYSPAMPAQSDRNKSRFCPPSHVRMSSVFLRSPNQVSRAASAPGFLAAIKSPGAPLLSETPARAAR